MTVTFDGVYPGYYGDVYFWVHNCGTIPLHIDHLDLYYEGTLIEIFTSTFRHEFGDDFELRYGNNFGVQMHPCDEVEISFDIHIFQGAEEGTTYTFTMVLVAIQWNEYYVNR